MHAVRNGQLCTKDCLCLYVCPTGATDTETGQIDPDKCIDGCRVCVDACPSNAISLVPDVYPPQQEKCDEVIGALQEMSASKIAQSLIAEKVSNEATDPVLKQLAKAIQCSNDLMTEDLLREAGYLLPQSKPVIDLLKSLLVVEQSDDFPVKVVEQLIVLMGGTLEVRSVGVQYQCSVCGYVHDGEMTDGFQCPICQEPGPMFTKIS